MNSLSEISSSVVRSCNNRVNDFEKSLMQCFEDFRELKADFEKICIDSESYKSQFLTQKEKCDQKICCSSEYFNKTIKSKNKVIQLIATNLTKFGETKNFAIIEDIFKVICEESDIVISPRCSLKVDNMKDEKQTPDEGNASVMEDISFNESGNEILDTPTGRTSPIIQSKKGKSKGNSSSSDYRDKKKCPDSWPTPEKKAVKLLYPTPPKSKGGGKLRQMRLSYAKVKQTSVVDLTCSPEFSGGIRCPGSSVGNFEPLLVKKESIENDDTIMPSPTSGPTKFTLFKTVKESPVKTKKSLSLKLKKEKENDCKLDLREIKKGVQFEEITYIEEDSVNILDRTPDRLINDLEKDSPAKLQRIADKSGTQCDNSISILQQSSPSKRPLLENVNAVNVHAKDMESSMSLLRPDSRITKLTDVDNVKRKLPESNEAIFKEPAVRKKSEKQALPGWICDECKNFYGVLYEDNPLMLAKMIKECSKHRGIRNPARPKTPPNFWNPRWEVPEDTEELNRMNNAI